MGCAGVYCEQQVLRSEMLRRRISGLYCNQKEFCIPRPEMKARSPARYPQKTRISDTPLNLNCRVLFRDEIEGGRGGVTRHAMPE
jgi:hypothetical protein